MRIGQLPRPTAIESVLALLLLAESVWELTGPAEGSGSPVVRALVGLVVPAAVAFSRSAPAGAAAVLVLMWLVDSFPGPAEGTLGAGFSMLAIIFGLAAWSNRPWPWLAAVLAAGTIRDLRMWQSDSMDMMIDWAFVAVTALAGLAVHHRAAHAQRLAGELDLSRSEQERLAEEAVARERATIARELHDIVAHSVSLMVVQAGTARPLADRHDPELAGVLEIIEATGRGALGELRRLLGVLRADFADDLAPLPGLDAIPDLVERVRRAGLQVDLRSEPGTPVPASIALCSYRVVQEGLTNALRHTNGGRTEVVLRTAGARLEVRVATRGGRPGKRSDGSGTGLLGLRERVVLTGGEMHAGPTEGWELVARLPVEPAREDA
jgi:signal transduction histidine kinase